MCDVLQRIKVNITVISRRNLDTVRNIDTFCQFGHTYASNLELFPRFFIFFIGNSIYHTVRSASYRSVTPIEADVMASVPRAAPVTAKCTGTQGHTG